MPTKPGDPLPGGRVAVQVWDAGAFIDQLTDDRPNYKLGTSMQAVIKQGFGSHTTKAEKLGP